MIKLSFDNIFIKHYEKILNFCYMQISERQAAEDCTQEVFFTLSKKINSMKSDVNISAWLYRTARYEVKRYLRKNKHKNISIETLGEIPAENKKNYGWIEEIVTSEEYNILQEYYIDNKNISKLADDRKISVSAMYQRIYRIKKKILKNSDKLYNNLEK